jgi:folate-binding protein YgfZ
MSPVATEGSAVTWVFRHPERETLLVSGPERLSWLNGVVTCDVSDLGPGRAAFGLALNRTGKIYSDLWLVANEQQVMIAVAAGTAAGLLQELQRMLIMEDAEIEQVAALDWVTVHGPAAASVAGELASASSIRAGGEISLLQPGDFVLAADAGGALTSGVPNVRFGSEAQWQALRIEHGLPLFGVDFDGRANPHDASLERRAVSWSKGCYLGQEVVCMQDMRGKPKYRMVPLQLAEGANVEVGATVNDAQGTTVGEITSIAPSTRLSSNVALVRLAVSAVGAPVFVAGKPAQRI